MGMEFRIGHAYTELSLILNRLNLTRSILPESLSHPHCLVDAESVLESNLNWCIHTRIKPESNSLLVVQKLPGTRHLGTSDWKHSRVSYHCSCAKSGKFLSVWFVLWVHNVPQMERRNRKEKTKLQCLQSCQISITSFSSACPNIVCRAFWKNLCGQSRIDCFNSPVHSALQIWFCEIKLLKTTSRTSLGKTSFEHSVDRKLEPNSNQNWLKTPMGTWR